VNKSSKENQNTRAFPTLEVGGVTFIILLVVWTDRIYRFWESAQHWNPYVRELGFIQFELLSWGSGVLGWVSIMAPLFMFIIVAKAIRESEKSIIGIWMPIGAFLVGLIGSYFGSFFVEPIATSVPMIRSLGITPISVMRFCVACPIFCILSAVVMGSFMRYRKRGVNRPYIGIQDDELAQAHGRFERLWSGNRISSAKSKLDGKN
jgi:uncharacterized membrane protein